MTHYIWSNLDFEYALRHGSAWICPRVVLKNLEQWTYLLRCMPGFHDAQLWDQKIAVNPHDLLCWGLDSRTPHITNAHLDAIKKANDKLTLLTVEPTQNTLPYSRKLRTMHDLHDALASPPPHGWIIKHPFGVSGRDRIVGKGPTIENRHQRWAEKNFASGDALLFEPFIDIRKETSWHFELSPTGDITTQGKCTILVDSQGTHRGHIIQSQDLKHTHPPEIILTTLKNLYTQTGYHGPLSTDGFTGHLDGQRIERHISEINARITFGRVAIELARPYLDGGPNRTILWWHPAQSTSLDAARHEALTPLPLGKAPDTERAFYRMPTQTDPDYLNKTVIYTTDQNINLDPGAPIEEQLLALWHTL